MPQVQQIAMCLQCVHTAQATNMKESLLREYRKKSKGYYNNLKEWVNSTRYELDEN